MRGPELRGTHFLLRPLSDADLPAIPAWFRDPDVMRYGVFQFLREDVNTDVPPLNELQSWLTKANEDPSRVVWAIEADGEVIGVTVIEHIDRHHLRARTHTLIGDRRYWRRGIATELVSLRSRYAFEQLGLHKLKTSTAAANVPIRKALQKNGYREVGIEREDANRGGVWQDAWLGELLISDWEALQRPRQPSRTQGAPTRTWPEEWEQLRAGANCRMCSRVADVENEFGMRVFVGKFASAFLQRADVGQLGYSLVIWSGRHVADLTELDDDEANGYSSDLLRVSRAIESVFEPVKLNFFTLGNAVPHLHTHVVPRYLTDDSPGRPPRFMRLEEAHAEIDPGEFAKQATRLRTLLR